MAETPSSPRGDANLVATPLRRELDAVLACRGEEREERLLASPDLGAVVALMPPEELFFTLKEMDPDNIPLVLAHARTEQVEFVLDLDLWKKDRLRPKRVGPWLAQLAACGKDALARWLLHWDLAGLTLLLGSLARVHLADEDADPFQDLPGPSPFTLDGRYYVVADKTWEPLIQTLLTVVREADVGRYHLLMEALLRDVDAELEEHCYQERLKRLAPRGFPEWEESMEVYARLEATGAEQLPRRPHREPPGEPGSRETAPQYALVSAQEPPEPFHRALRRIRSLSTLEAVRTEMACLTNKVVCADGLPLDRTDSYDLALRKVVGYVSIGLEALCGFDEAAAAEVVENHWLQHLFRVGWTRVRAVRGKARRLFEKGWPQGRKERLLFLDPPLPQVIEGLLRPHPQWFAGEEEAGTYRTFQRLEEVVRAEHAVEKADFLGRFLLTVIDLRLHDLREAQREVETENLRGSTVFLTAVVNAALGRDFRFAPVEREAVQPGLRRLWRGPQRPARVRPELVDAAVDWSRAAATVSEKETAYLREFVAECFALLEEEFGHLPPDELPDPRFTRGLWIQ
ncbi:MAG: hypothetical protein Kow0092_00190 [Deferrisomatales bacterium]